MEQVTTSQLSLSGPDWLPILVRRLFTWCAMQLLYTPVVVTVVMYAERKTVLPRNHRPSSPTTFDCPDSNENATIHIPPPYLAGCLPLRCNQRVCCLWFYVYVNRTDTATWRLLHAVNGIVSPRLLCTTSSAAGIPSRNPRGPLPSNIRLGCEVHAC